MTLSELRELVDKSNGPDAWVTVAPDDWVRMLEEVKYYSGSYIHHRIGEVLVMKYAGKNIHIRIDEVEVARKIIASYEM